tara:strand:+ start:9796 stop:10728 length:933 start_codon:yes stop_codon:yes gene_type:complete
MEGVVFKSTGNLCYVVTKDNTTYHCKIKGKTRLMDIDFTNPIAVGDNVLFNYDAKNKIGVIDKIQPRKNYIIRKSVNLSHKSQIIASNIDLAILMVTIKDPITSLKFIDRFLIQAEAYGVETKIIFNKIDLHDSKTKEICKKYQRIYQDIGYETIPMSVLNKGQLEILKELLRGKRTVISGHSGVGKSSLINALNPTLNLKTNKISKYHNQGIHTTTYAEMFSISNGGYVIDTPGIKGLGLIDLDLNSLSSYFKEMARHSHNCKFKNCTHINEPGCEIITQIKNNTISKSRYLSYCSMLATNTNYRKNNF